MGRNKKTAKGKKKQGSGKKYTVDDLLCRVEEYLDCFQFELAIKFCEKALEIDPVNLRALETAGNVYAEFGDIENSKSCLLKAVEIDGDNGHEKYMYLGQMSDGDEAKSYYLKGIEIMKNSLENKTVDSSNESGCVNGNPLVTKRDISNAYCALAEVFLTDACEEEDAEQNCLEFAKLALEYDDKNPEAYIIKGNFLLSKDQKDEAKSVLQNCFNLLSLPDLEAEESNDDENSQEITGKNDNDETLVNDYNTVPYANRFALAKLLIEVELFENAERLLMSLVEENDEDLEVWYMLGWNLFLQEQFKDACYFLTKALEICQKLQHEDTKFIEHVNELLSKCKDPDTIEEGDEEMEIE